MPILNPTDLTFNGEELRELREAIIERSFTDPAVTEFCTVYEGIVAKKQIVFMGRLSKITKADAGCGTGLSSKNIPMTQKFWEPEPVKFWLDLCASDLEGSFLNYMRPLGIDRDDITATDIATFITMRMSEAAQEDLLRIIWFGDVDALNTDASPTPGNVTAGVSLTDYTILDGFWKQIYAIVTASAARRYTISENSGANYAAQALAAGKSLTILRTLLQGADPRLKSDPNKFYIVTDTIFENYATYLESQAIDASYTRLESGFSTLAFRGIMIYSFQFWDRTIDADFNTGTKWFQPHRAILTTKETLAVGYDLASDAGGDAMEVWYERKDEKNNFRGKYRVDAKVLEGYMLQVAY
jgi:hypothetical protein